MKSGALFSHRRALRICLALTFLISASRRAQGFAGGLILASRQPTPWSISPLLRPVKAPFAGRLNKRLAFFNTFSVSSLPAKLDEDEGVEDVPDTWREDDILVEFDEDLVETDEEDSTVRAEANVDDDDDDDEIDGDFDLDEEEEEDEDIVIAEESFGSARKKTIKAVESAEWDSAQVSDEAVEWDEEEDGGDYELEDDPDDPDYTLQKQTVEAAIAASEQRAADDAFDPMQFLLDREQFTPEMAASLDELPFFKQVEAISKDMVLTDDDVSGISDLPAAVHQVPDLMEDDPYPRHGPDETNYLERGTGLTDDDMEELDRTYKGVQDALKKEPWDKVMLKSLAGFDGLANTTLAEMDECLREIGGSAYNVTNWLLYDLDFNVSNLILAAVKHNRQAPILFQHWYPQLLTYERYQHARDRNFDFNWDDVETADMAELERYYAGFGYDDIPNKAPSETGIISLEDLDEEDIKMAAFENWMTDVYNPEADRKDFDDDEIRDEDNVFSDFYEAPQHPDLPTMEDAEEDLEQWREELGDDPNIRGYRDMMGRSFEYDVIRDEEFEREYRGHLIIACTGDERDLETAEKITSRFTRDFGKKVFVETRVMALAREEDNVFEIWLESYEIDLLHSKKRATSNAKGWNGPAEVNDAQIDYLAGRVQFLISDEARYSYRLELDMVE